MYYIQIQIIKKQQEISQHLHKCLGYGKKYQQMQPNIITQRLRTYFYIQDDKNIQVSILTKQQIKCSNLLLKVQQINKKTMPIHIKYCRIGLLEISFNNKKTSKKPLNVKIDHIKLICVFNRDRQIKYRTHAEKIKRPVIQQFYKAVGSEQEYQQRNFLQEQLFQLKQLITQYALGQLYLNATNIDISIEYQQKPKYLGIQIQQIQAKQEIKIQQFGQIFTNTFNSIHCDINKFSIFLGIKDQQTNVFTKQHQNFRKVQKIHKKNIMNKTTVNVLGNLGQHKFWVNSKEIRFNFEDILVYQVLNFVKFSSLYFNDEPKLRPGEGQYKTILPMHKIFNHFKHKNAKNSKYNLYEQPFQVTEGTLIWWQRLGDRILQKFNKKINANILTNKKYRKYLFCLLYRYTYGSDSQLQKIVDDYQYFKTDLQIMNYNKQIISKIQKIKTISQKSQQFKQLKLFVGFFKGSCSKDPQLKDLNLKKVDIKDIKKSNVIVNYANCRKFVRAREIIEENSLTVSVNINRFYFDLKRMRYFQLFKNQVQSQSYKNYMVKKNSLLEYYCEQSIVKNGVNYREKINGVNNINQNQNAKQKSKVYQKTKSQPKDKVKAKDRDRDRDLNTQKIEVNQIQGQTYAEININSLNIQYNSQGNMYIKMPLLEINDPQSNHIIAKISRLLVSQENLQPETYAGRISAEKRMELNIDLIYLKPESNFAQKMLTFLSYMTIQPEIQIAEEQKNFISQFITKKVPNHPIFNSYKQTSMQVNIKQIIISTSVFDRQRNFEIDLKGIRYDNPINGRLNAGIEQIFMLRSSQANTLKKINSNYRSNNKPLDQAVIMTSTRPFDGYVDKQGIKNITNLVIPFIIVQLSCQDLYYAKNIMNVWLKILSNPFYFPPKIKKKQQKAAQINKHSVSFAKQMKKLSIYQNNLSFQIEGIQLYLLSDYLNQENNRILDLLLDSLTIKTVSTYYIDKLNLQIRDIFIRNCLSFKGINKQSLVLSIKDQLKYDDEPVLFEKNKKQDAPQQRNIKMDRDKQLLLYATPKITQKNVQPFLNFTIKSEVSLQQKKSLNKTLIEIVPIYIFYSLQFTEMMGTIFFTIESLSSQNIGSYDGRFKKYSVNLPFSSFQTQPNTTATDFIEAKDNVEKQGQIMSVSQFQQIDRLSAHIQKINFLAVKNCSVVYTISMAEISVKHRTQPYVQRFQFNANRLLIVDTSQQAGPQPIIIDLQQIKQKESPLRGSYTSYKSQIMRYRMKKSAFFHLQLITPQIYFLKKKVLQLNNFIMIMLRQLGILAQPDQQIITKAKNAHNNYPLRYKIQLKNVRIRLFRSSLSLQGLKSISDKITVTNYLQQPTSQVDSGKENNHEKSVDTQKLLHQYSDQFVDLNQQDYQKMQFASFTNDQNMKASDVVQKIFIHIDKFYIYGAQNWTKQFKQLFCPRPQDKAVLPMMQIPLISIQFCSPQMAVNIRQIDGNMTEQDYRVLIRLTQQNLSQTPLLFVDHPRVQRAIHVSFRTTFVIQQFNLSVNILQQSLSKLTTKMHKKVIIKLNHLTGKNELWTNGQILTQLSVSQLQLTTQNNIKIIGRLNEQYFDELPQIPKSNAYTQMQDYPKIKQLYKNSKKVLNHLLLQNQVDKIQLFQQQNKQQFNNQKSLPDKTNTQRICQWIKGMLKKCQKCCKWCYPRKEQQSQDQLIKNILQYHHKKLQRTDSAIFIQQNKFKNRTAPMIFQFKDMLDFQYDINWPLVNIKKKQNNMIYLNFVIRPNGEKQMYMQAKKMEVLLENSKGLIGLSQFFGRPYAVSDVPEHVRRYKFNNNKPFKMLIEVDDALAQIRAKNQQGKTEKVSILCDLVYDTENRGDSIIGPGISKMRVQSVAKILFISENFKKPIDLSDNFKLVFLSENRVPYGENKGNQIKQDILLKTHQKQDWNISFFIPAFILKPLSRIILFNFSKAQNQDQLHEQNINENDQEINLKQQRPKLKKSKSVNQNEYQQQKALSSPLNNISKKSSQSPDVVIEHKKQQLRKPAVPIANKQQTMIRSVHVPQITLQIQSKLQSSFIKSKISDIQYSQIFINNRAYKRSTRRAIATTQVNYWNLKLGVYQPCIQPWRFRLQQDLYQRDNLSSSNFKIASQLSSWADTPAYTNDLNVNISIALYQTYKELMIVYQQENYDENQDCIDLTTTDGSDYDSLFRRTKKIQDKVFKKTKNFPKKLTKYFTRVFNPEGQNLKKYLRSANKAFFNPPSLKLFLYHSYFDHFRRNKCVTYRTPYRIFNSTNVNLALWFYDPKQNIRWRKVLKMFQYYAIPNKIYTSDFLVHISQQDLQKPSVNCPYISVKYLVQMRAKKKNFEKINPQSATWKNIFKYSSGQNQKYIDYRDMIIRVGNHSFAAITVFSKYKPREQTGQKYDEDIRFYDSYCILQSPIIIDNYTYLDLRIKVDHKHSVSIPRNQRIQINQNLSQTVSNTILQFQNDTLHEQRNIFWQKYGDTQKTIQITKLQSIKILITHQTISSCVIKLFTQWNISNFTNQNFSLKNSQRLLLIDKLSYNCLSNISSKGIDLCLVNQQKHTKRIKPNNLADVVTLAKKRNTDKMQELLISKQKYIKSQCCGLLRARGVIYQHIQFVLNAKQDTIQPLRCQKIEIRYRYLIRNHTDTHINLCQHDSNFIIAQLPASQPGYIPNPTYIFYYNFIPKVYFLQIEIFQQNQKAQKKQNKKLKSCDFKLDQFPGSTFVIKIKNAKNQNNQNYQLRFYYLRIEIKKMQEQTLIQIMKADFNDFPIYLDNVTDYQIKVMQGQDQIILKPQHRIPFAWSHLTSQQYKLQVSIESTSNSRQIYQFNNKSAFEPLKIIDQNKKKKKKIQNLYLKQNCYVNYQYLSITAVCLVILDLFDNKLRIHNRQNNINIQFNMNEVAKIVPLASKIQVYFNNESYLQLMPPSKSIKNWIKQLQQCINQDVVDKIFFTIQSYNNSRIFFFRTLGQQQYQSSKQQYKISHLNVSLISTLPQQVILLYCGNISYIQHDKQNKLNYKELELSQSQKIITIQKIKVSNQTKDSINPVVLSQIKKSNYPFIQLRLTQEKLHFQAAAKNKFTTDQLLRIKQEEQKITHYKQIAFFMDQAQVMVQAALFLKLFGLKKSFDYITNQYAVGLKMFERDRELLQKHQQEQQQQEQEINNKVPLVCIEQQNQKQNKNPQVYINYLQIKPIKMTVSVYLDHNSNQEIKINLISILRYIPFGIENAIIQMESYQYFHVFYDLNQLKKQFIKYYTKQAWNQIYKNAGSYDMFVPIQLVGGVGNGVKQIFYDPIYELVRKKEIKAVGKTFCEGILSFIVFLVKFFFKLINLAFKILAVFTFDQQYKTKRQSFRKQIFKSPVQAAVLGGKNFLSVFKSFFIQFKNIPRDYNGYFIFGYILGFLICLLKIIPWSIKLVVSFYDWIYVIGLGLVNWGYYQQSAMKARSRPRRTFYHKQITTYNYLQALGNEIILKNQLQQIDNQQIFFIQSIEGRDDSNYLILSNYRIIHNYHRFVGMQEVKLYQINAVRTKFNPKKYQYHMVLQLIIPNSQRVIFLFTYNLSKYKLNFISRSDIIKFLKKLKFLCDHQKLNVVFDDDPQIKKQFDKNQLFLQQYVEKVMETLNKKQDSEVLKQRERWHKPSKFQKIMDVEQSMKKPRQKNKSTSKKKDKNNEYKKSRTKSKNTDSVRDKDIKSVRSNLSKREKL